MIPVNPTLLTPSPPKTYGIPLTPSPPTDSSKFQYFIPPLPDPHSPYSASFSSFLEQTESSALSKKTAISIPHPKTHSAHLG
ncbi:hypothetical protein ES707_20710 [subsurface metagenome]